MNEIQFLIYEDSDKVEVLDRNGKISHNAAKRKAIDGYNKHQQIISDFDKEITKIRGELE